VESIAQGGRVSMGIAHVSACAGWAGENAALEDVAPGRGQGKRGINQADVGIGLRKVAALLVRVRLTEIRRRGRWRTGDGEMPSVGV
jgi:hypothetical protein